ncbi:uncharacterized protein PADG_12058 [Paracoccidioides brasiliensis Pb18]|uniref:Uncharacterized protein n=1 Tax=Paracoccidioides brasiliensis (strain Pb18) TaxID=502780 RepID=A0A0A0HSZ8_PARBD|nr:uncharacterized protein PADG_12058 [Paracoccidioides brasiliensis Pb18]KGM91752.1 hypothetical protein PADG_12058 [Paracoccidioides brasiliensis Pb18]
MSSLIANPFFVSREERPCTETSPLLVPRSATTVKQKRRFDETSHGFSGSQALTLAQKPVSIFEEQLGTGAFGQVDLIIDVSTAARFRAEEILQTCLVGAFFSFIYCRAAGALI